MLNTTDQRKQAHENTLAEQSLAVGYFVELKAQKFLHVQILGRQVIVRRFSVEYDMPGTFGSPFSPKLEPGQDTFLPEPNGNNSETCFVI